MIIWKIIGWMMIVVGLLGLCIIAFQDLMNLHLSDWLVPMGVTGVVGAITVLVTHVVQTRAENKEKKELPLGSTFGL
jgi:hypothetical protein